MQQLIGTLLAWIAVQLGIAPPEPPAVEHIASEELVRRLYGDTPGATLPVMALYRPDTRTIYLAAGWRDDSLLDRSALLHELVHHVQEMHGIPAPCPAAHERLAYDLQARWLTENGIADPYGAMGTDAFTIALRSSCNR